MLNVKIVSSCCVRSFMAGYTVLHTFSVLLEFFYWLRFIWLDTLLIKIAKRDTQRKERHAYSNNNNDDNKKHSQRKRSCASREVAKKCVYKKEMPTENAFYCDSYALAVFLSFFVSFCLSLFIVFCSICLIYLVVLAYFIMKMNKGNKFQEQNSHWSAH